jgi:16S rRNA G1207 methylase RsmC
MAMSATVLDNTEFTIVAVCETDDGFNATRRMLNSVHGYRNTNLKQRGKMKEAV